MLRDALDHRDLLAIEDRTVSVVIRDQLDLQDHKDLQERKVSLANYLNTGET